MITVSESGVFALRNSALAHVFCVNAAGLLEHIHHGAPVREPERLPRAARTPRECSVLFEGREDLNLNTLPQEYPSPGRSDYRRGALAGYSSAGAAVLSLRYKRHRIAAGKPALAPLPATRETGAQTLSVDLEDTATGLCATLHYTIWPDHPVIARSATFSNAGQGAITLTRALSSALDLPPGDYDAVHLHGSWAREMSVERLGVPQGVFEISSTRGTSSAAHAPFIAVTERETTETAGRVWASTLVYSGNHLFSVETGEFGDVRLLCGLWGEDFAWRLEPGETFQTPEALLLYSETGLGGMSAAWHDAVRALVLPERFAQQPRPTFLNTWEAAYFDVDEARVLQLADSAAELGVEMLVLDDGWFGQRRDDTSSLGDWVPDPSRFPRGIPALARDVAARGLRFGIWVEPEMASPDSDLLRAHPDWALQQPGRTPSKGRNQLCLDMGRAEVRDHLYERISALLDSGDVSYVKWDMNRAMSEIGSAALPANRQREAAHRSMLGTYALLRRLTERFPDVLFESCASGGNRFDLGMLSLMPQSWTSDMVDPVGRADIVSGASLFLPTDCMAAYVGPSPNHQNGRVSSLRTRFLAGVMCAAHGVSLGARDIADNLPELQRLVAFSKATAAQRLGARFARLVHTRNNTVWQMTSRDGRHVWVLDIHVLSGANLPARHVRLRGLDAAADYRLQDDGHGLGDNGAVVGQRCWGGDALMAAGLPLPRVTTNRARMDVRYAQPGDFAAHLFVFEKETA